MTTQLPSDTLSRLKRYAEQNAREPWIPVKATELLALVECAEALLTVKTIAAEAHAAWDADNDMRVGKILIALSGRAPRYRTDIDRIHAATTTLEAL